MKILLLSYHYSPASVPRAIRWSAIAEAWVKQGIQVDVVCASRPDSPAEETRQGVRIFRTGSTWGSQIRDKLNRLRNRAVTEGAATAHPARSKRGGWVRILKRAYDLFYKSFYWPDSNWSWFFPARRQALALLAEGDYQALITISHPFTGQLVGLSVQRRFPHLRWIADIGDPFCILSETPTNNHRLYGAQNYRVERKLCLRANGISVTTPETAQEYIKLFPEAAEKIRVIPPLLSPLALENGAKTKDGIYRIVFIGTFYKTIRNPGFLLALFSRLVSARADRRYELHLYGAINDCGECFEPYAELMGDRIIHHGLVAHAQALRAMQNADMLVNIGNRTYYQLPSKVVEYASTGKPILNLVNSQSDSSAAFFASYPAAWNCVMDAESPTEEQLRDFTEFAEKRGNLGEKQLRDFIAPFRSESIAQRYLDLLSIS